MDHYFAILYLSWLFSEEMRLYEYWPSISAPLYNDVIGVNLFIIL